MLDHKDIPVQRVSFYEHFLWWPLCHSFIVAFFRCIFLPECLLLFCFAVVHSVNQTNFLEPTKKSSSPLLTSLFLLMPFGIVYFVLNVLVVILQP